MRMLNKGSRFKTWLLATLSVASAAGLIVLLLQLSNEQTGEPDRAVAQAASAASPAGQAQPATHAQGGPPAPGPGNSWFDPAAAGMPAGTSAGPAPMVSPLSTMSPPQFAADKRGKLVLNADTHANLEKLLLEEDPAVMQATLAAIMNKLPPAAAAELKALVAQFQQYTKALSHSISPENAPENAQEGFKLLDSLHKLRVSYLGPEAARAMFGPEEASTRQLIALMEADKDSSLTPQQKAEKAQEILRRQAPPG